MSEKVKVTSCSACGREVYEHQKRTLHRQVVGWEKPGRGAMGKSGSSIILRRYTGAVAHQECIEKLKRGINPGGQTSLF